MLQKSSQSNPAWLKITGVWKDKHFWTTNLTKYSLIWIEFGILLKYVDQMNLIFILSRLINIHGRKKKYHLVWAIYFGEKLSDWCHVNAYGIKRECALNEHPTVVHLAQFQKLYSGSVELNRWSVFSLLLCCIVHVCCFRAVRNMSERAWLSCWPRCSRSRTRTWPWRTNRCGTASWAGELIGDLTWSGGQIDTLVT